jgi:hypothetical protein
MAIGTVVIARTRSVSELAAGRSPPQARLKTGQDV